MCFACASAGSKFDPKALSTLVLGTTTEAQAIAILGSQPYQRIQYQDGSHLFVWSHAEVLFSDVRTKAVSILFDQKGRMVRFVSGINVELPAGAGEEGLAYSGRRLGVLFAHRLPNGDFSLEISVVQAGSLAEKAGWRRGDVILSVDAKPVGTATELATANQQGDRAKVYVLRRGEQVFESQIEF